MNPDEFGNGIDWSASPVQVAVLKGRIRDDCPPEIWEKTVKNPQYAMKFFSDWVVAETLDLEVNEALRGYEPYNS